MKYYRSNRRGRYDIFALHTYLKSQKKTEYLVNTDRSKKLESFFLENQVWGALHKAWKGYVIAKNKAEDEKMELYARRIQELQHDLGLEVSSFPNIGISPAGFFWQLAQEENDSQEQQVVAEEQNYLGDSQYERESQQQCTIYCCSVCICAIFIVSSIANINSYLSICILLAAYAP
jgi:hypothetical protein